MEQQSWQVRKIPHAPSLSLSSTPFIRGVTDLWWECPDLCNKAVLADELSYSSWRLPRGQHEPVSCCILEKVETRERCVCVCVCVCVFEWKSGKSKNVWTEKQHMLPKRLEERDEVQKQTQLFYFFVGFFRPGWFPNLYRFLQSLWGRKKHALSNASLRSTDHPQMK